MNRLTAVIATALLVGPAEADAPRILTDIAPIYSLVTLVVGDKAKVELMLDKGQDPHSFQLRPSQARALSQSDLIIWTGPQMQPLMEDLIATYDKSTQSLALLQSQGTYLRQAEHNEHDHEDAHEDAETANAALSQDAIDPHAWLDLKNAQTWVQTIADRLSTQDPQHSAFYQTNAKSAAVRFVRLDAEMAKLLAPIKNKGFVVSHDALGYFVQAYGLNLVDSVSTIDAQSPSAAHVAQLNKAFVDQEVVCFFPEIGHDPKLGAQLANLTGVKIGAPLDPGGLGLAPRPDLYENLMRQTAQTLRDCLAE